jgi:hypothetical protein
MFRLSNQTAVRYEIQASIVEQLYCPTLFNAIGTNRACLFVSVMYEVQVSAQTEYFIQKLL